MTDSGHPDAVARLPRVLTVLLIGAMAVIVLAGVRSTAGIIAPMFLALMLTITMEPGRQRLLGKGVPRWLVNLAGLAGVYTVLFGLTLALTLSVAKFAGLLPQYQDEFNSIVDQVEGWLSDLGISAEQTTQLAETLDLGRLVGFAESVLGAVTGVLSGLFFVATMLLFMGLDATMFGQRVRNLAGERSGFVTAITSFAAGTRRYLWVSTVFGAIVAVIDTGVLWAMGIPVPVVWGLLAFLTNYIPNIGFVIGLVPPAILALLEGGPVLMLWVIVAYSLINFVLQSIIQPRVIGDAVGLSGTVTFLSLVFWAWLLGPLGALLAVPLSLLVKALLIDVDPANQWMVPLLAGAEAEEKAEPGPKRPLARRRSEG